MKKLHILIPSLAIASTLPALTAVSCGNQKIGEWKQSDGEFKWVHDTPKFSVTRLKAIYEYFNRVTKDIFADDIVKSRADAINDSDRSDYFKNWMIKVEVNEINKENCLCSLTIHESGDNEIWLTNEFTHTDYTITLVNIPFDMGYTSSVYGWHSSIYGITRSIGTNDGERGLDECYSKYETWSFSIKGIVGGVEFDDLINHDCLSSLSEKKHQDALREFDRIYYISSFFKNVTVKEG